MSIDNPMDPTDPSPQIAPGPVPSDPASPTITDVPVSPQHPLTEPSPHAPSQPPSYLPFTDGDGEDRP